MNGALPFSASGPDGARELQRLTMEAAVHERLRELFLTFSRSLSGLSVADALQACAGDMNSIFRARHTTVWLHDRDARHLTLCASSGGSERPVGPMISTADESAPAARGLRLDRPRILTGTGERVLVAPLRGWRRALGTVVMEGQFAGFEDQQLVAFAHELVRQLAAGIENVQLIEEVLRHREQLAQSERLASLGQFVAGIAHEMNNPLQGVLGHLELLIASEPRPLRRQLKRIFADADRAAKIVRNLLVFSGARRMTRRRLSIDTVLTRALASRKAALRTCGIRVVRRKGRDLPLVSGDPLLLQQAILNVLVNAQHAVEATGAGGGRIEVATRHDRARHTIAATVRDSGCGIPADALPRIFDPFFTTKEVGKGTGLGLAITYGIVQEHGGRIHAENLPDGGAVVTIELPVGC